MRIIYVVYDDNGYARRAFTTQEAAEKFCRELELETRATKFTVDTLILTGE